MNIKRGLATLAIAALSLTSLAACGSDTAQDEEKPDSLSFWYYEEDDAGQTQAWRRAAKAFEKETGVKINFERKSFTQIAQNGSQFLNSDEALKIAAKAGLPCYLKPEQLPYCVLNKTTSITLINLNKYHANNFHGYF